MGNREIRIPYSYFKHRCVVEAIPCTIYSLNCKGLLGHLSSNPALDYPFESLLFLIQFIYIIWSSCRLLPLYIFLDVFWKIIYSSHLSQLCLCLLSTLLCASITEHESVQYLWILYISYGKLVFINSCFSLWFTFILCFIMSTLVPVFCIMSTQNL